MGKGVLRSFGAFIGVRPATSKSSRDDVDLSIKSSQVAGRQGRLVPVWRPMLHGASPIQVDLRKRMRGQPILLIELSGEGSGSMRHLALRE